MAVTGIGIGLSSLETLKCPPLSFSGLLACMLSRLFSRSPPTSDAIILQVIVPDSTPQPPLFRCQHALFRELTARSIMSSIFFQLFPPSRPPFHFVEGLLSITKQEAT